MRKNLLLVAAFIGLVSWLAQSASAINPRSIETDWTPGLYYSTTTSNGTYFYIEPDTMTVKTVGFSWSAKSVGGDTVFSVSVATNAINGGGIVRSTSTDIRVLNGDVVNGVFSAMAQAPVFHVEELAAPVTFYLWVDYGIQKQP